MYPLFTGCGQGSTLENKAVCIFINNDSLAYYYGNSGNMQELRQGRINDTVFTAQIVESIKKHLVSKDFKIAFKPTTALRSVDTTPNIAALLLDIFRINKINDQAEYKIDTLDSKEKTFFKVETWYVKNEFELTGASSLTLTIPAGGGSDSLVKNEKYSKNAVTIIICGNNSVYVYDRGGIEKGKKYDYSTIDFYLKNELKAEGKELSILIKPNDQSTYKNLVDITNLLKQNGIEKYALLEITPKEDKYVKALK